MKIKKLKKQMKVSKAISNLSPVESLSDKLYRADCPFHEDKEKSLMINDKTGIYKCTTCDAGGDLITFYEEYFEIGYIEAVELIQKAIDYAPRAGIQQEELAVRIQKHQEKLNYLLRELQSLFLDIFGEEAKDGFQPTPRGNEGLLLRIKHELKALEKRSDLEDLKPYFNIGNGLEDVLTFLSFLNAIPEAGEGKVNQRLLGLPGKLGGFEVVAPLSDRDLLKACLKMKAYSAAYFIQGEMRFSENYHAVFLYGPDSMAFCAIFESIEGVLSMKDAFTTGGESLRPYEFLYVGRLEELVASQLRMKLAYVDEGFLIKTSRTARFLKEFE